MSEFIENQNVKVFKYIVQFAIAYILLLAIITAVVVIFELGRSAGFGMGALIGAAYWAMTRFVAEHKRIPGTEEKRKLVWGSVLAAILISMILPIVFLLFSYEESNQWDFDGSLSIILLLGFVFFVVLYWAVFAGTYGWAAKKYVEQLNLTDDTFD